MKKRTGVLCSFILFVTLCTETKAQIARHHLNASAFQTAFNQYSGQQNLRLMDISVYEKGGTANYAAVWDNKPGPDWSARHGMSETSFLTEVSAHKSKGYRPHRISVADINGSVQIACIFYKTNAAWVVRQGMTSEQYQAQYNDWTGQGYRLIEVCGYKKDDEEKYAAVWEKSAGPPAIHRHSMSVAKFQTEFDKNYSSGYRPVRISAFEVDGESRFAAIFEKMNDGVYTRLGLTEYNYQAEFDNSLGIGSSLKHVCAYNVNGKVYFAGLWMGAGLKNDDLNFINSKVKKYMDDSAIPGLSIAVMKEGRLVYARGYGVASAYNDLVSTNSLFRIASVSKPVTAAAIMRLTETTTLKLSDKLFGPAGILGDYCATFSDCIDKGDAENITVQHCLEHTTGWTQDAVWQQYQLNNVDIIKWALKNYSQATPPGVKYQYINFDYFLLARVIEKKSGMSYQEYVKKWILSPCGISRMQIGSDKLFGQADYEVTYFSDNNFDPYALRLTRMDGNGGWIATPTDLLRFAAGIDGLNNRKDFLTSGSINTMKTISTGQGAGNYAKGLMVNGKRWGHNGCMTGTLAGLWHFPNKVSVAITINTRPKNDDCHWNGMFPLAKDIGEGSISWPTYDLF